MDKYVIFTDIDGTLLNDEHKITKITKDALLSLQQQGHSLVLASGRDIHSLAKLGDELNMQEFSQSGYIALNGLEIYNSKYECLHKEKKLQKEDIYHLAFIAESYSIDMVVFFENCLYIVEYDQNGIMEQHFLDRQKYIVKDVKQIDDELFNYVKKVAFVKEAKSMNQILPLIQKQVTQYEICKVEDDWVEINPVGATKGKALKKYLEIEHIDIDKSIAFGNAENDIDMLQTAHIGVAMANAFDNVKNAVKYVCLDNNHDGIAKFLKEVEIWR